MPSTHKHRLQSALWLGAAAGLLILLYLLSGMLAPFVLGGVAAYICAPMVDWLAQRRIPRTLGTLLALLLMLLVFTALLLIVGPLLYREGVALITRLPDLAEILNRELSPALRHYFDVRIQFNANTARNWLLGNKVSSQDLLTNLLEHARLGSSVLIALAINVVLVPVAMFYMLRDWPQITRFLMHSIPRPWHPKATRLLGDVDRVLSEFLRGQLSVMVLLAGYYSLGLWMAGVHFAPALGVLTGLLIFIPYVGYGLGLTLALLVAILQGMDPSAGNPLLGVLLVYGIGQVLEGMLLTPYLVGERIGLHPLAVIFALFAFGELFGFTGVLVALPVSAALLVALREIRRLYLRSSFYLGVDAEPSPLAPDTGADPVTTTSANPQ